MSLRVGAEIAALARFLTAPRRRPRGAAGMRSPWVARTLLFALLLALADGLLSRFALDPLGRWAGLNNALDAAPTLRFALLAIGLAPLLEELLFRAGLRQPLYTLWIGPVLIAVAVAPWTRPGFIAIGAVAALATLAFALLYWAARRRSGARFAAGRRYVAHYAWVFWLYALLFAALHAGNYDAHDWRGLFVAALLLPQFAVGGVAGYLRLRDGLRSSLLLHVAINTWGVAALYITA